MATGVLNPKVDGIHRQSAAVCAAHPRSSAPAGAPWLSSRRRDIQWSRPFFEYKGVILFNMSAFKAHCSFGFWGAEIGAILRDAGAVRDGAMGTLGRITGTDGLPPEKVLLSWIRQAAAFVDNGEHTSPIAARNRVVKAPRPAPEPSAEFAAALRKNRKASTVFAAFSPSCKREDIDWIAESKREETSRKRIAQAVQWIAEGKQRNWKYQ